MQNLTFNNYYLSNDDEIFSSEFIIHHSKVTELVNHINNDFLQNDTLQNLMIEISKISELARRMTGAEALLRWQNDSGEWISSADFIAVAEESELIIEIGNWVLRPAIQITAEVNKDQPESPFVMAIKIAPCNF